MASKIQLTIPEPCHEKWNKMTPVEKGRFCHSCQKQVVDFSAMSDREVAQYFKQSAGSVCGRFMQDQLERELDIPKKRIPWARYFIQFVLPAFLTGSKAMAQGAVTRKISDTLTLSPVECNRSDKDIKGEVREQVAAKNEQILKGIVTDDNGQPIDYCTVIIKGTGRGTTTGKQGEFSLTIPGNSQTQTLVFSYVGFETKEMTITKESFSVDQKVIMVELKNMVWMGFVIVKKVKSTARPITLIPMTNDTASKYFTIFPNPLPAGNELTIQWQRQEEGYYLIELINSPGQSIFSKKVWVDAEARLLNLEIPSVVAGNYFIRIANTKTNKSFTEKIVIQ